MVGKHSVNEAKYAEYDTSDVAWYPRPPSVMLSFAWVHTRSGRLANVYLPLRRLMKISFFMVSKRSTKSDMMLGAVVLWRWVIFWQKHHRNIKFFTWGSGNRMTASRSWASSSSFCSNLDLMNASEPMNEPSFIYNFFFFFLFIKSHIKLHW
jgi:hypothetical protein